MFQYLQYLPIWQEIFLKSASVSRINYKKIPKFQKEDFSGNRQKLKEENWNSATSLMHTYTL